MPQYKKYSGNSREPQPLPPTFTCRLCGDTKASIHHYFTSKEMDRWQKDSSVKLRCRECAGDPPTDIMCIGCDKPKVKEEFSMAARNRPETAKCRDCVTWHELAEPSTETLARFAQEALREDEGEGYVPPVDDEDEFPAIGSVPSSVRAAHHTKSKGPTPVSAKTTTDKKINKVNNEFVGFGHSQPESDSEKAAYGNATHHSIRSVSKGHSDEDTGTTTGTKSFDSRYAPVINWLDSLQIPQPRGHKHAHDDDLQSISGHSLCSVADSFKDLDPFEEANSDLKFTLAKTLTRSQADKPLAIGGSNCPVPYGRSTKVPQTVEQKREALARILGKPVNKPTFPATVVPKDRCEAHSTSVDDRKSDFGGSNISVMPPGLRPALVPSVPNLMDEPVPSNQGKKSAWSGTPALSSKRLVLKGSAKEPVPKSSVPAPDASVNSNTDQEQASSVKAPMNTWLGRKGFVTADPRKTLSKEAPESSSDPNRGNVWRTATVDSCTKDSVEKSLRLLKITRNSEQAASKRDAAQPLLDGSEFDYPSLGSERSTQAPSGGALRSKFNANGGKTLLDESEIGYPATRDTKPELANIWDASAKSSSAISSAKSKMIANVWGEKMVDLSELDPFKTGSVRKENMPIKRDSATSESWRKPPVAKPTRKQPAPLAEKEKKPSKVEAKKAAPPASTAANRFALLMDGNEEGDEDAKDAQNDDGGDEMSTGGTGTSGRVHVSWW